MKTILTAAFIFFAALAFGQFNSDKLGVVKRGNNYVITDTIVSGADTIVQTRITSEQRFIQQYIDEVARNFEEVGRYQAEAITATARAEKQRDELQKLNLLGTYLQYIDAQRNITGTYRVSYNNTNTTLNAGQDEHLYTQGGVKVVNVLEIASNWIRCTLITMGNEVIDVYEIRPGLWAGNGNNGLLIIQR